jgi:hypothetical protein
MYTVTYYKMHGLHSINYVHHIWTTTLSSLLCDTLQITLPIIYL